MCQVNISRCCQLFASRKRNIDVHCVAHSSKIARSGGLLLYNKQQRYAVSIHPGFAADAAADEFTAEPTLTTRACIENGKGQAVYVSEVRIWADSHLSGVMRTHDGNLYEERGKGLRYINFATQLPFQPYESQQPLLSHKKE